jgi:ubiquinone biosynthesis protein
LIPPGLFFRLVHISWVLIRNGLDELILATHLFRPVRYIKFLLPWLWFKKTRLPRAVRCRCALEELGPVFVKFGQQISTRRDLLPNDIADEFARLQDQVRPFPGEHAKRIIEKVLGSSIGELFAEFDENPLASASIAQVHAAKAHAGGELIVKVVRPGIEKIIRRDLRMLYALAELAQRYWPDARLLRPKEIVDEFSKTIIDELDMVREAANASQLRRNFKDSPTLYVPKVEWEMTRNQIMVMERVHGIPISNAKALRAQGIDLKKLAERGVDIFFTQVFRHCFFHADMHPGNVFVSNKGQYISVDFGIMGSLGPDDQNYLAQNFLAFFNRDYRKVAQLHVESGWVPRNTRVDEFEAAIRTVCEPIFQKPLKDISFGHFLLHLFQTVRRFNMEVQPQLVLLQKTLLNIEALGRQLYPELDLWQTAKPFFEKWMREQIGPAALAKRIAEQRHVVMEQFLNQFMIEWDGRDVE